MYPDQQKYLDPKNDFAFKKVFGSEANKDILIAFLNDVLDHQHIGQIVEIELLPSVINPEVAFDKESLVDLFCRDQNGAQYIIEMQVAHTKAFIKRAQYYAARAFSKQLREGEPYTALKEVIFLAITDFVLFPEKEAIKSDHVLMDRKTHAQDLHSLYFTFIELPKFKKGIDELESNTERWYYYLKHAPETVGETYQKLVSGSPMIARAYEELERYSWSEEEVRRYESMVKHLRDQEAAIEYQLDEAAKKGREEGEQRGLKKGKIEGHKEGKAEGLKEAARQMLADGEPVEKVQKWTGLSLEAIQALRHSI